MSQKTSPEVRTVDSNPPVVAVIHCPSYDPALVEHAVARGIELIGGIAAFAQADDSLLFKPNVLCATDPAKCVVTHPSVLRAAVAAFSGTGARLYYGDSPSGISQTEPSMKKCGYDKALGDLPASIISFDKGVPVNFPQGHAGKRLTIAQAVLDSSGIINLPKLKAHGLTRMTGAIKNLFGCTPMLAKGESHARFPDVYDFSQLLADIAAFVKPRLHIMDAIEAMEGNGPRSGTAKKLGVLLISTDPVALDVVACKLINLDPACVPTIAAGVKAGLGCGDFGKIRLAGDALEPRIDLSFDVVRTPPVAIPQNTILGAVKRLFLPRPVINRKKCTGCGRCVSACPLKPPALSRKMKKKSPTYNYSACIRCYCCQEVCPSEAISICAPFSRWLLPFATYISLLVTRKRSKNPVK